MQVLVMRIVGCILMYAPANALRVCPMPFGLGFCQPCNHVNITKNESFCVLGAECDGACAASAEPPTVATAATVPGGGPPSATTTRHRRGSSATATAITAGGGPPHHHHAAGVLGGRQGHLQGLQEAQPHLHCLRHWPLPQAGARLAPLC